MKRTTPNLLKLIDETLKEFGAVPAKRTEHPENETKDPK